MRRSKKKVSTIHEEIDYPIDQIERLGRLIDEIELRELASRGRGQKRSPINAPDNQQLPADSTAEDDLVEASPKMHNRTARSALSKPTIARHSVRRSK
jgi:hypothetical protein